ncbi:MAG TPA: hypothetical protein VFS36_15645 [Chitinophagaceae bacterium]|nr:hypothetical protein [Chitinophagaceae bacterium]
MNITYLFGAGASANSLPVVSQVPNRINEMIIHLSHSQFALTGFSEQIHEQSGYRIANEDIKRKFVSDLKWMVNIVQKHASIDTYAKKLFIRQDFDVLKKLKLVFSTYLYLEQCFRPVDYRYDTFFASILFDNINKLPDNIRIISWNYDFQFEKAFADYSNESTIQLNKTHLNIYPSFNNQNTPKNGFKIIKLNGTTDIIESSSQDVQYFSTKLIDNIDTNNILEVLEKYYQLTKDSSKYQVALSFAWEQQKQDPKSSFSIAKQETSGTDILVVIGYSFPYFNRDIDRALIKNMNNLYKVYFQSPEARQIKERFLSVRSDIDQENLIERVNISQFLLPDELE